MTFITQREEDILEFESEEEFNQQWEELVKAYLGDRLPEVMNGNEENNGNSPEV
jgi:hypothetical protein